MQYISSFTRRLLLAAALLLPVLSNAQRSMRIVTGNDHNNQVYFSLDSGVVHTISADDWDLGFNYSSDGNYTISINEGKGMKCWMNTLKDNAVPSGIRYNYQYDPTTLDTTGMSAGLLGWTRLHNSVSDLKAGAFNRKPSVPQKGLVDYGHSYYCLECTGMNNAPMHGILGYRNFVVQLEDGSYRQVVPVISASTTMQQFFICNMNGTGRQDFTWNRAIWEDIGAYNAGGQMYVKFDSVGGHIQDTTLAPRKRSYDLVFTDYFNDIDATVNAFTSGVLSRDSIAQIDGRTLCNIRFDSATLQGTNNVIGDDWKTTSGNVSTMVRNRYYIVKSMLGVKYLVWFTDFDKQTGTYGFRYMTKAEYDTMSFNPQIAFAPDADSVCPGRAVRFVNRSVNAESVSWSFPGGTPATSTDQNPVVTYAQPGAYSVSLQATSCSGASLTLTEQQRIAVTDVPVGDFQETAAANTVHYTNQSTNARSYAWDFGDGGTSSDPNPTHTYAASGTYLVQLVASNDCDRDTVSRPVTVSSGTLGVAGQQAGTVTLYPNPAQSVIHLEGAFRSGASVSVYDATGRCVLRQAVSGDKVRIDVAHLAKGIYQLVLTGGAVPVSKRFAVN